MVFDSLQKHRGVYLFDEFDSIGAMRALNNDVGEIRRVLNSFLQFIDHDCSNSMILAATNHPKMLDYALFRRFDDVIEYSLPDNLQISELLKNKLAGFVAENIDYSALAKNAKDLSFAEITRACEDSIKEMIIARKKCVTEQIINQMLQERIRYHSKITCFLDMKRKFQQEWIDDLLRRLPKTISDEVAILLLDTGVNNEHPLIKPFLSSNDLHAYNIDWLKTDECGHGTGMAGLALYSDLMDLLVSNENVSIEHILESGKIIRQNGNEHQPELYGSVTSQVISLAEINAPERKRVISLTITAKDFRDRGKPSSWSSAIDKITSGAEEESGTKRLLIVSSGNIETQNRIYYPDRNIIEGIHDPGQSWNALCVGAYTQKVTININDYPGLVPIAPAGDINPASTTSIKWDAQWPLKPDVVFEGGNWAKDVNNSPIGGDPDEIRILTTNDKFTDNYFTSSPVELKKLKNWLTTKVLLIISDTYLPPKSLDYKFNINILSLLFQLLLKNFIQKVILKKIIAHSLAHAHSNFLSLAYHSHPKVTEGDCIRNV